MDNRLTTRRTRARLRTRESLGPLPLLTQHRHSRPTRTAGRLSRSYLYYIDLLSTSGPNSFTDQRTRSPRVDSPRWNHPSRDACALRQRGPTSRQLESPDRVVQPRGDRGRRVGVKVLRQSLADCSAEVHHLHRVRSESTAIGQSLLLAAYSSTSSGS